MHNFFLCPPILESMFHLVLWKAYNQILLALKTRFPGDSLSLFQIPRLGSPMWGSEPSQQCENFFVIILLHSVCHSPGVSRIWLYLDFTPPIISLWLLLCLWTWSIIFLVGASILLLMVVQQVVAILVLLHEEMSTCPSFWMESPLLWIFWWQTFWLFWDNISL